VCVFLCGCVCVCVCVCVCACVRGKHAVPGGGISMWTYTETENIATFYQIELWPQFLDYFILKVQPIPLGVTFSNAVSSSKLKARTSLFIETWQKRRSSFELWAFENDTPNGIGCNRSIIFISYFQLQRYCQTPAFCLMLLFVWSNERNTKQWAGSGLH